MTSHITNHHIKYRLLGGREQLPQVVARVKRVSEERLAEQLSEALDVAFEDDPAVYMLRDVKTTMGLNLANDRTDGQLSRQWAKQATKDIVQTIAVASTSDGGTLMRFEDQADYVAHFITDLLNGQAWQRWFYQAFAQLKHRAPADVIQAVLSENKEWVSLVLANLYRMGMLDKLLQTLDMATVRQLWQQDDGSQVTPEMVRPLFTQAIDLVDRLNGWVQPQPDREALFLNYLSTNPTPADWRDKRSLSQAVVAILQFLLEQQAISQPKATTAFQSQLSRILPTFDWLDTTILGEALWQMAESGSRGVTALFKRIWHVIDSRTLWQASRPDMAAIVADYVAQRQPASWWSARDLARDIVHFLSEQNHIDTTTADDLARQIDGVLSNEGAARLPTRPNQQHLTPRQAQLLADLGAVLGQGALKLDQQDRAAPQNGVRWYAALIAYNSDWADDGLVSATIRTLLMAWQIIGQSQAWSEALGALRQGQLGAALATLPEAQRRQAANALKRLLDLGPSGLQVMTTLTDVPTNSMASIDDDEVEEAVEETPSPIMGFETHCAGLFLLLRGILDSRLPSLVHQEAYPSAERPTFDDDQASDLTNLRALLLALGLRWGGENTFEGEQLDLGFAPFVGLSQLPTMTALRQFWQPTLASDHRRFQAALLRTLAGQRLLQSQSLHLYCLPLVDGQVAIIGGDESSKLWPLGEVISADTELTVLLNNWLEIWVDSTGYTPSLISGDQAILTAINSLANWTELEVQPMTALPDEAEPVRQHQVGQAALLEALAALDSGQLDLPNVDLTVALTAIALLRIWARWLRQFSKASVPYLLENFIRRTGHIEQRDNHLYVTLADLPLDVVLEIAGYLASLEQLDWLDGRHIHFQRSGL